MWQRKHLAVAPASGPVAAVPDAAEPGTGAGFGVHPGQPPASRRMRDLRGSFRKTVILRFEPGGADTASGVSALRRAASHAAHGFDGGHTVSPASLISMSSSPAAAAASSAEPARPREPGEDPPEDPRRRGGMQAARAPGGRDRPGSRAPPTNRILEYSAHRPPAVHRAVDEQVPPARARPALEVEPALELDLHLSSTRDCTARDRPVGQFCFRGPASGGNRRDPTPIY